MELFAYILPSIVQWLCIYGTSAADILYGLHSDELKSGTLIIPKRVNERGVFLTHDLKFRHDQNYRHEHSRRRRSVAKRVGKVHYRLDMDNETIHLELEPHTYFMAPNFVIERHRRDIRTRKREIRSTDCHFHGKVRGHSESNVAISTCEGLVGHIKTKNHEYYIEPSKYNNADTVNGHPHVLFHKSSLKLKNQDNNRSPDGGKHRQKQKPREALVSNCGTKEPKIHTETRLEWQAQGKVRIQGGRKLRRQHLRGKHHHQHRHQHQNLLQRMQKRRNRKYLQQTQHLPQTKFKYETASDEIKAAIADNNTDFSLTPNFSMEGSADTVNVNIGNIKNNNEDDRQNMKMKNRKRTKRSISSPRHVEALIVADATMVAFHSKLETYLLTIMNMVSALYKDPSIGNLIEIVVVKIVLLEEHEAYPELNLTQNAQKNLDTFCSWQHKLNTANETDPYHHDVAILITRTNICGNNCMTLGLANVGGMCKPKQSCSVNEDNGIMLSHTIAHELGHNFGMFHDTAKIGCHPRIGSIVHIMTPTFGADTLQVCWSNCSRKYITQFLDQGLGNCLDDTPTPVKEYVYPALPPGVLFDAERQCRLQFNLTDSDVNASSCTSMTEICSALWCRVNGECVTNMRPTAPGTSCGDGKWCQKGECVPHEQAHPVNGSWGEWSEWSECSRACGGGVSTQKRECNNPVPANGGLFCIGERKRYKICNHEPCPLGEVSFRAKQCSKYDNVCYQGATYKWLPFFDKKNPCKLLCTDVDDTIIANWGEVVKDGTPCRVGTNDMCIDGICKKVGCDWVVDSDVQEDQCGVCGGNNDQCKSVKEQFEESLNVTDGYVDVVTIPAKARHIMIKESRSSHNFLAISRANSSYFYLNGDGLISMPGEFNIAGTESLYDRIDEQDSIKIPQPIEDAITVHIIVRGDVLNAASIHYEFTLPALNNTKGKKYFWKLGDWTQCTSSCGGGVQYRIATCYEDGELTNAGELCWTFAQNKRPKRRIRACNRHQCPEHWWAGPWQYCPVTCKWSEGVLPVRRRTVMCLDENEVVVQDDRCNDALKPPDIEPCSHNLPTCKVNEKMDNFILRVQNL
ncbi:A disintegrin and metalloproteinase with thrombospondin motifs 12 [Anastrepha obliqua]|uniref:A disintegrin and metalloproteinase with thrombospondin motifs 12 n=1 Tax=Anastrepha obliqua TaxID=95512 RepID=UPI00240A5A4C|nr:A disintegrin and metalloproteinase with thrombospondin motifs 12 [Anastrepha obliqua]XP_054731027.1 A disintegrin and metalloproteinase with thrombospondin motifs 12 [Anastrepha obliqua]XP_054731028.1 A disintegrin and metalloproteinase with thrombospondin motifs 12 [Anastrepha obliqua]XP_054731029.1 A disintegrin and metalloproteinase with thrombospondin motifs 12 [Anastrepha obliqua]XP_054731030.1 A disintegrin and metalloproteinase with thrombospondin motifs 12 [Anastrepha obliqua]XP_05